MWTDQDRQTLEETHATVLALRDITRPPGEPQVGPLRFVGEPQQIASLMGALAKARAAFPPIPCNCTATVRGETAQGKPFSYEFEYADLGSIVRATAPALGENALALFYPLTNDDGLFRVQVILAHAGGGRLESDIHFAPVTGKYGPDDQKTAGRATYWTRYGVRGVLGIAAESDDDGNAAAGNEAQITKRPEVPSQAKPAEPNRRSPARQERRPVGKGDVAPERQPPAEQAPPPRDEQPLPVPQVGPDGEPEPADGDPPASNATIATLRKMFQERGMTKEQARITIKVAAGCTSAEFEHPGGERRAQDVIAFLTKANAQGGEA